MTNTEAKLVTASEAFTSLLIQDGWEAVPVSPKGYQVKVRMTRDGVPVGSAVIYHSAKKGYSFVVSELKSPDAVEAATRAWNQIQGGGNGQAESAPSFNRQNMRGVIVYVDGSYRQDAAGAGTATYGLVALRDGRVIHEDAGVVESASWTELRNVAGEMRAVMEALTWAEKIGEGEIAIAYDYQGLESWATGAWRANNPATRSYREVVGESPVRVSPWVKVAAHTGDRWNDRADALAKSALPSDGEDSDVARQRKLDDLANAYVRIREAATEAGYVLAITLDREDQLKFSIASAGTDMGSGQLFTTKNGPSLKLHECRDRGAQAVLRDVWDRRHVQSHVSGSTAPSPGAELARTVHVLSALAPYRTCRVNIAPLREALRSDLIEAADSAPSAEARKEIQELATAQASRELTWATIEKDIETARTILST